MGVGVFRSPFYLLYCQTYRGGFSIDRELRVEISARFAFPFRSSVVRGASGRHIRDCIRAITFHCVVLPCVCSFPGVYSVVRRGISTRCISTVVPGNISPKNSAIACTSFGTSNASGFLYSFLPGSGRAALFASNARRI